MTGLGEITVYRHGGDILYAGMLKTATAKQKAQIVANIDRLRLNLPWGDFVLDWYQPEKVIAYKDLYAIYVGQTLAAQHPEWILKDSAGGKLYLKYGGPPYAQWAGDVTNPDFRAHWIAEARALMSRGIAGLFIDDCNYYRMVCNAGGNAEVVPIGAVGPISKEDWMTHLSAFLVEVRRELPGAQLTHNTPPFSPYPEPPEMTRALKTATYADVERGVIDGGLKRGTGKWGFLSLLSWVERRHAVGTGVVYDPDRTLTLAERRYSRAVYYLTKSFDGPVDMLADRAGTMPDSWWSGYDMNLGKPLSARYHRMTNGLLTRPYEGGRVYVNEPGAPATKVGSITLGPASGIIVQT